MPQSAERIAAGAEASPLVARRRGPRITVASHVDDDVWDGRQETEGTGRQWSHRVIVWTDALAPDHTLGREGARMLLLGAKRAVAAYAGDRAAFGTLFAYFYALKPLVRWMSIVGVRTFGNLALEEYEAFEAVRFGAPCRHRLEEELLALARGAGLGRAGTHHHRLLGLILIGVQERRRQNASLDCVAFEVPLISKARRSRNSTAAIEDVPLARLVGCALDVISRANEIVDARAATVDKRLRHRPKDDRDGRVFGDADLQAAAYVVIAAFTVTARPADIVELRRGCAEIRNVPGMPGLHVALLHMRDVKRQRRAVVRPAHPIVLAAVEVLEKLASVHPFGSDALFFSVHPIAGRHGPNSKAAITVSAMAGRVVAFADKCNLDPPCPRQLRATVFDRLCTYSHGFSAAFRFSHERIDTTAGYALNARFDRVADEAIPRALRTLRGDAA